MSILWLAALPLAMAAVLLVLREVRLLAAPLTAATLVVLAIYALANTQGRTATLLGRSIALSPLEAGGLAFCALLLAMLSLYGYGVWQGSLSYPLALATMGFVAAATMMRNVAISALLLQMAVVAAVLLVPARVTGAAMAGMRALVVLTLLMPLLLLAGWAIDGLADSPGNVLLLDIARVSLALAFGLGVAAFPLHVWLPPVLAHGSPMAMVALSVVISTTVLLFAVSVHPMGLWSGAQPPMGALLLATGLLTVLVASVVALTQQAVHRVLAYAAVADMGLVLVGLGLGTPAAASAATLHAAFRGLAVLVVAMAVGVLRACLDGDDPERLRGAFRRAPLALVGMALGGASLSGLPLTAGFASRLVLLRELSAQRLEWALILTLCAVGPGWGFGRCIVAALTSAPIPGGRREPLMPALLTLAAGLALLVLGISPGLLARWFGEWLGPVLP